MVYKAFVARLPAFGGTANTRNTELTAMTRQISAAKKLSTLYMMRIAVTTGLGAILSVGASTAFGQSFDVTCTSPADIRQILVVSPGVKGAACDVVYSRDRGVNSSTPYYANSDASYCLRKATEMRERLRKANYTCQGIGAELPLQAGSGQQQALNVSQQEAQQEVLPASASTEIPAASSTAVNQVASQTVPQTAPQTVPEQSGLSKRAAFLRDLEASKLAKARQAVPVQAVTAQAVTVDTTETVTPLSAAQTTEDIAQVATKSAESLGAGVPATGRSDASTATQSGAESEKIARVPSVSDLALADQPRANGEPVTLTTPALNERTSSTTVRLASSTAGDRKKLVGATPVVLEPAVPSSSGAVSAVAASAAGVAPETTSAPKPKAFQTIASALTPAVANRPRTRPEIIKATLTAQAAAWNEGDIEAFMEGYWRDPQLRFVSGTEVSRGWSNTLRRYKKRYGNGAALGQLTFNELDVQMIADDISIVVGRFNLVRGTALDTGTFTLVMKRFEGAWRIVHDHTVADAPVEPAASAASTGE